MTVSIWIGLTVTVALFALIIKLAPGHPRYERLPPPPPLPPDPVKGLIKAMRQDLEDFKAGRRSMIGESIPPSLGGPGLYPDLDYEIIKNLYCSEVEQYRKGKPVDQIMRERKTKGISNKTPLPKKVSPLEMWVTNSQTGTDWDKELKELK